MRYRTKVTEVVENLLLLITFIRSQCINNIIAGMQGCENINLHFNYYCYLEKYFVYVTGNFEKRTQLVHSEFDYELTSIYG